MRKKPATQKKKSAVAKIRAKTPIEAAPKRKKHEDRALARTIFVTTEATAAEIADKLHLSPKTVGKWREEDGWDEERTLRNVSPAHLIKRFNEEIELILNQTDPKTGNKKKLNAGDILNIKNLTKSVKDLRNSVDPQTNMEVLNGFISWLSHVNLSLAQQLAEFAIAYVRVKMKEVKTR